MPLKVPQHTTSKQQMTIRTYGLKKFKTFYGNLYAGNFSKSKLRTEPCETPIF